VTFKGSRCWNGEWVTLVCPTCVIRIHQRLPHLLFAGTSALHAFLDVGKDRQLEFHEEEISLRMGKGCAMAKDRDGRAVPGDDAHKVSIQSSGSLQFVPYPGASIGIYSFAFLPENREKRILLLCMRPLVSPWSIQLTWNTHMHDRCAGATTASDWPWCALLPWCAVVVGTKKPPVLATPRAVLRGPRPPKPTPVPPNCDVR
jgi:hypothetical protein